MPPHEAQIIHQSNTLPDQPLPMGTLIIRLLSTCAIMSGLFSVAHGYYSNYYLVAAKRGQKTIEQYESLLRRAVEHDSTNGRTTMEFVKLLMAQKKYVVALELQKSSMNSYRPLAAFEQLGSVLQKFAESETGESKSTNMSAARSLFEKADRVRPGNIRALENLMLMAYKDRDDSRLESLASQITRAQVDNLNPTYLRAMAAERAGNNRAAYGLYQRLVSVSNLPPGSLFTTSTIAMRIRQVSNNPSGT